MTVVVVVTTLPSLQSVVLTMSQAAFVVSLLKISTNLDTSYTGNARQE